MFNQVIIVPITAKKIKIKKKKSGLNFTHLLIQKIHCYLNIGLNVFCSK